MLSYILFYTNIFIISFPYLRYHWMAKRYNCHIHYLMTVAHLNCCFVLRFQNIRIMFRAQWNFRSKHKQMTLRPLSWLNEAIGYLGYILRSWLSNVVWLNKANADSRCLLKKSHYVTIDIFYFFNLSYSHRISKNHKFTKSKYFLFLCVHTLCKFFNAVVFFTILYY